MADTVRTFIAVELPEAVRQELAEYQDRLRRAGGEVRWVRPDRIHLTLAFLGEVPTDMLDVLEAEVREAVAPFGALSLRVAGAGRFPSRGRPRVVWVGIEEPTGGLVRLQKAVAEATAAFAEKVENRPYQAHLTLGRVRGGGDLRPLSDAVDRLADGTGRTFQVREVVVMKSKLTPQGPEYTALARVPLVGAGD